MKRTRKTPSTRKVLVCPWPGCQKQVQRAQLLRNHYRVHTKVYPFECMFKSCTKKYKEKPILVKHIKSDHHQSNTEPFMRIRADLLAQEAKDLGIKEHSTGTIYGEVVKSEAIDAPTTLPLFDNIILTETGFYRCPNCDYHALDQQLLKRHYRSHGNVKPFSCLFDTSKCNYSNFLKSGLQSHIKDAHSFNGLNINDYIFEDIIFLQEEEKLFASVNIIDLSLPVGINFFTKNQPPNSPTFDSQADGAGNCSPNLPQDSEAAALNFDDIENTEPFYNHQMILDGTAKIQHDIIANYPFVSETITVDALHDDYAEEDDIYQQKIEDLKTNYSFIRKTRPDGNCFYRAFIFSYFESLFNDENEQKRFLEICKETRRGIEEVLGFPDFTIDEFYEYFRDITTGILEKRITTATELLNELDQPDVYDNIVIYLRLMTSYYLQKESDFFTNFIEGNCSIGDFCKREVEQMYKESDHIHIIALSSVFNVTVRVVYMDRSAGGKVNEHDFNPLHAEGLSAEPRILMLYRPGHYDVLYARSKAGVKAGQGFESLSPGAVLAAACSQSPLSPASVPSSPAPHQQLFATCPSPAHPGHNSEPDSSSNGQNL